MEVIDTVVKNTPFYYKEVMPSVLDSCFNQYSYIIIYWKYLQGPELAKCQGLQ